MRKMLLAALVCPLLITSCDFVKSFHTIKGNGQLETEDRQVAHAERIRVSGGFDVELTQGAATAVKIEADENLLPYIVIREENGELHIGTRDHTSLSSEHNMKIYITTPRLTAFQLAGSGNVTGTNKFSGGDKLTLKILGSGDLSLDINTPELSAEISGSGNMALKGETEKQNIRIAGSGDYKAEELKAEETKVSIAGQGDVRVFADVSLDVSIAGAGSVYYKGAASVKQHVVGSGEIKKIQ
ncbi:head GIN domain-containing protein [Sediminibacterium soli]|uniref:head GIN domain-containing protein n=1 Tax=Sediminibacterium soli TaxID=2698829 RepID=UPI00137A94DB|nr:head GIN domain-containing protein [Sediminibacterium soli]NCI48123.1 DUF2807 domain-containing protein [Sediminibacterium soli]